VSQLQRETPSGKTGGSEGIKSSRDNLNLEHRQDLEKSYYRCTTDLLDWFIANNYDKLLPLNPEQLFKELVAYVIKQNNPYKLPLTDEIVFKSILAAHTKTKKTIENLYFQKVDKSQRGDL
jgi:hypothetical protein